MTDFNVTEKIAELSNQSNLTTTTLKYMNRVLNGDAASIKQFPFAVFILIKRSDEAKACAGSLISADFVVTAAHCLISDNGEPIKPENVYVSAGSVKTIKSSGNIYMSQKVIVHPKYGIDTSANDIALIKLTEKIPENVATPTKIYTENVSDSLQVRAAGWGLTSNQFSATGSDILNYVDLNISSSKQCQELNPLWKNNNDYDICTLNQNGKDTCYGDSGGPLTVILPGLMPLLGLTSFGNAPGKSSHPMCGQPGGVGYYTNLKYHLSWILQETNIGTFDIVFDPNQRKGDLSSLSKLGNSSSSARKRVYLSVALEHIFRSFSALHFTLSLIAFILC